MSRGIDAAAVYLPHYRLRASAVTEAWGRADMKGIERKTVAAADEDALTMAVAAGERVLDGREEAVDLVCVATTTPPLYEDAMGGRLVRALGLSESCETNFLTGSTEAGASALSRALDANGTVLVIVSDAPQGDLASSDHRLGAGAVAFVITDNAAVSLVARGFYSDEAAGVRYRPQGTDTVENVGITGYERGAIRDAVAGAAHSCGDAWDDIVGLSLHQPDGGLPYRMASALGVEQGTIHAGMVVGQTGDLGAATVPIGLAKLLDADESPSAACFFGGGSAAAFVFAGTLDTVPGLNAIDNGEDISYTAYLRMREALGRGDVSGGGARVSLPNWQQSIPQRYRLLAGTCDACGGLNFPPEGACQSCHERTTYIKEELAFDGIVEAVTVIGQGGAPPEFADQQRKSGDYAAAIVSLGLNDTDGNVRIPSQVVDCDPSSVEVGDRVQASFRRIYTQEGIVRYGRKFVPR